ncbi:FadR/GntR family transcriptional regulator [Treponema sp. OMZ 840]|uniref:FadR/GntR family transcriptional regulator n=1 Tax=Treponema sp. OMZ 840 TaxID=244313 RepID=UPI003D8AB556
MSDNMKTITRIPVTSQIVDAIKEAVKEGQFPVGEKLPAELSLCKMMNVSRSSVREALYQLQAQGYVELKPGKGAFVRSGSPDDNHEAIRQWFISSAPNLEEYMEVRFAIDPLAASLAAEKGTDKEIQQLSYIHVQFVEANKEQAIPRLVSLDEQFHTQILEMTHNKLLKQISELLLKELKQYRMMSISAKKNSDNTITEHYAILQAIRERNKDKAQKAMIFHLDKAREGINAVIHDKKEL